METVEDIPKDVILGGLPWDWESFPEYLDFLERSRPALNVAGLIGHSTVRFYVMGERSVEEDASEEEIRQMAEIVGKAVEGGAVGFSTNRHEPHKMPDGRSIPGTFAAVEELEAIAQAVGPLGGMMQAVGADFKTLSAVADAADSRGLFIWRMFSTDLKEQADLFKSKNLLPSLGDVGAHVSQIMDAGWCSFMLSHWVRKAGVFSLAEAVRRMTSAPARVIGLADRGVLAPGMRADINVFDPDAVTELQPEVVHDFPGGTPRYIQRSKGYKATLVNGQVNMMDGESTGARAGRVLRHRALAQAAE
jgi:N-acyl-D-aspartate/D-glutamate deacylase